MVGDDIFVIVTPMFIKFDVTSNDILQPLMVYIA